ncbi:MAG: hypothetical protein QGI83_15715 [Candidatus Latescibacteria bacterium]|jgi:hypothetical protein|nr:hypothetical protein [Candidatus Latescibacterota bacterium]
MREHRDRFPECPYGYLTWTNSDGDYFPGADPKWVHGAGAGGTYILWNRSHGIVFASAGIRMHPSKDSVPQHIEACLR